MREHISNPPGEAKETHLLTPTTKYVQGQEMSDGEFQLGLTLSSSRSGYVSFSPTYLQCLPELLAFIHSLFPQMFTDTHTFGCEEHSRNSVGQIKLFLHHVLKAVH